MLPHFVNDHNRGVAHFVLEMRCCDTDDNTGSHDEDMTIVTVKGSRYGPGQAFKGIAAGGGPGKIRRTMHIGTRQALSYFLSQARTSRCQCPNGQFVIFTLGLAFFVADLGLQLKAYRINNSESWGNRLSLSEMIGLWIGQSIAISGSDQMIPPSSSGK